MRAGRKASIRAVGPRAAAPAYDDEVAVRAERDAERDVDVERDRRPGGRRVGARRCPGRGHGISAPGTPMTRQPSGTRRRFSISSTSRPRRLRLTGVAGAQEDREAGDRMAQEGGGDPAGPDRQPAADQAHAESQDQQVAVAAGRPEPGRQRVQERLDQVRDRRLEAGREQEPEERAAEGDLVDEGRGDRVEQGARVGPRLREADAVVAEPSRRRPRCPTPASP